MSRQAEIDSEIAISARALCAATPLGLQEQDLHRRTEILSGRHAGLDERERLIEQREDDNEHRERLLDDRERYVTTREQAADQYEIDAEIDASTQREQ